MNDLLNTLPTVSSQQARRWMRQGVPVLAEISRRSLALVLVWLMVPLGVASMTAFAQEAPPPPPDQQQGPPPDQGGPPPDDQSAPPQQWQALSPDQLNQLVAPIALYPDSLVAQVVAAATYPTQIVDADRFVQSQGGAPPDQIAQMVNGQNWDPSVKALCAFPSVLSNMDKNLDWTTQLGNAYYNQPQDVMSAVQNLRQQAYQQGHLQSSAQLNVAYAPDDIVIAPANPSVVYVPYYNPWSLWGFQPYYAWYAPPPPMGYRVGIGLGFGVGIAVAAYGGFGWGWGHWGFAWGPHPYIAFNHGTYISRSVTVVNHGYYGHFDRNPGARAYNAQVARTAYAHGYANGAHNGYNAGARNGYNAGEHNGYDRGAQSNNYRAPANNNVRPAQNYNRPAQNNNFNRQQGTMQNRPAQNSSRPNTENRPANQGRPQGNQHTQNHPQGGGDHPHGGEKGGGEKGGGDHPHSR